MLEQRTLRQGKPTQTLEFKGLREVAGTWWATIVIQKDADGKVTSRTIITDSGEMKSLGVMLPGLYRFSTEAPETASPSGPTKRAAHETTRTHAGRDARRLPAHAAPPRADRNVGAHAARAVAQPSPRKRAWIPAADCA